MNKHLLVSLALLSAIGFSCEQVQAKTNPPGKAGGPGHGRFWHYNPQGPKGGKGQGWVYNPPGPGKIVFNNKNNPPGLAGGIGHGRFWRYNPQGPKGGKGQGWIYNPPGPGKIKFPQSNGPKPDSCNTSVVPGLGHGRYWQPNPAVSRGLSHNLWRFGAFRPLGGPEA